MSKQFKNGIKRGRVRASLADNRFQVLDSVTENI